MGTTAKGIVFPDPSGVPSRAAFEELAESADDAIGAAVGGAFDVGAQAVTTSAAGLATLSHGLGRVPVVPFATVPSAAFRAAVTAVTDTTLTVHVVTASSGANFAGNVSIRWFVA